MYPCRLYCYIFVNFELYYQSMVYITFISMFAIWWLKTFNFDYNLTTVAGETSDEVL